MHAGVYKDPTVCVVADEIKVRDPGREKTDSWRNFLYVRLHDGHPVFVWDATLAYAVGVHYACWFLD